MEAPSRLRLQAGHGRSPNTGVPLALPPLASGEKLEDGAGATYSRAMADRLAAACTTAAFTI
jgi:hypothetical protein